MATDGFILDCGDERALPRVLALVEEVEEVGKVLVGDCPGCVLPDGSVDLGASTLGDRR